jgi:hypothetical protein
VRFFGNKTRATRILLAVTGFPASGRQPAPQNTFHVRFHIEEHSMKKLLTLIALVGMGAFMAGCAEEKPAPPPSGGTPMHGPGAVGSPPKHDASGDKMSEEKAGKGDTDADKDADADKDEKKEE